MESTLGFRRGFFGLIAQGWEIEETTGKQARGALPEEAKQVECIVGTLDSERACGEIWTLEDFNRHLAMNGWREPRPLTDEELGRMRARSAELFAEWRATEPGKAIELRHEF